MTKAPKLTEKKLAKALILTGDGLNSEIETARAFELAGAKSEIIHINDLCEFPDFLHQYQILAIPGGFSYGDHLGSGKILSLKIKNKLMKNLNAFIKDNNPIIGICNGFQVLMQLGLLPYPHFKTHSLTHNRQKKFINRWVELQVNPDSPCVWTRNFQFKNIQKFDLPIRHGEGAVIGEKEIKSMHIPLTYSEDVNGSMQNIAGLCDESGLIFGLMPHPEIFIYKSQHPNHSQDIVQIDTDGDGLNIFKSAIDFVNDR